MATIQSVQRALKILSFYSLSRVSLGLGELRELMGLPRGTVHGLVRTLVQDGFLRQDPETRNIAWVLKSMSSGPYWPAPAKTTEKQMLLFMSWLDAPVLTSESPFGMRTRHFLPWQWPSTIIEPDQVLLELEQTRQRGYALAREELFRGFAAPQKKIRVIKFNYPRKYMTWGIHPWLLQ